MIHEVAFVGKLNSSTVLPNFCTIHDDEKQVVLSNVFFLHNCIDQINGIKRQIWAATVGILLVKIVDTHYNKIRKSLDSSFVVVIGDKLVS
jgi:hypothetical protein